MTHHCRSWLSGLGFWAWAHASSSSSWTPSSRIVRSRWPSLPSSCKLRPCPLGGSWPPRCPGGSTVYWGGGSAWTLGLSTWRSMSSSPSSPIVVSLMVGAMPTPSVPLQSWRLITSRAWVFFVLSSSYWRLRFHFRKIISRIRNFRLWYSKSCFHFHYFIAIYFLCCFSHQWKVQDGDPIK